MRSPDILVQMVSIPVGGVELSADLATVIPPTAVVAFAHGSGSGRHSPRNRRVAERFRAAGLGTLLLDLLTEEEERRDRRTGEHRFDIALLADRLTAAVEWLEHREATASAAIACFGASTGAAAALIAAARRPDRIGAVVSRGGRPDLAAEALGSVKAPTLLIVGGADPGVLDLNRRARAQMPGLTRLEVVEGAGHLFEEPGALDRVADLSCRWILEQLRVARHPG